MSNPAHLFRQYLMRRFSQKEMQIIVGRLRLYENGWFRSAL